jgi:hypothetical protein
MDLTHVPVPESQYLDLWVDESEKYALLAVRGSKTARDFLVDDVKIAIAGDPFNRIQAELSKIASEYKGYQLEIAGHSLGCDLIATAFAKEPELLDQFSRVDLFNPGSSALAKNDSISKLTQEENVHFYLNLGDVVSAGLLPQSAQNVIMAKPSLNPVANHGLAQWTNENLLQGIKIPEILNP